jgi:hypothetical protein
MGEAMDQAGKRHDTAIGIPPRKWCPLGAAYRDCLMEIQHRRRIFIKPV